MTIFITGASGYVGRHVLEALDLQGHTVRALMRAKPSGESSAEIVQGDLSVPESYAEALDGVTSVVHCAAIGRPTDAGADSKLYEAGARAGVQKFIYLSSIAVYGCPPDGIITEETPPLRTSDEYSHSKVATEQALLVCRGIPELDILRLGCVYGSNGGWWTTTMLRMMQHNDQLLVNGGAGIANLIHVQDAASLICSLIARSNLGAEVYNVTDGAPITWSDYFATLEAILGRKGTRSMTAEEAEQFGKRWLKPSFADRLIRKLRPGRPVQALGAQEIAGFASRAIYSNRKAVESLGFEPATVVNHGRLERPPLTPQVGLR